MGAAGATGLGLVAGCVGRPTVPTPAAGPAPALDSPAATDLDVQPWLGDRAADRLVIVFEDPSCPVCRVFEDRTFPTVREELVDPGRVAFVSRGFPAAASWAPVGLQLLEATFARDPAAFWGLRAHLFANQPQLYADESPLPVGRAYLASETAVDARRVVRDVEADRYAAAVDADEAAAADAGVRGTPTFFLFTDGDYLTKIEGAPSYDLLATALGV